MNFFLALFAILVSAQALAETPPLIDKDACRMLVAHQPSADAEYKPGVDVKGQPVVEADLTPSPIQTVEEVTFDITVDVARYAGIGVPNGFEGVARVGTVTVDKQGRMTFNGQPLESGEETALRALCFEKPALQKDKNNLYNK